jgi:cation diffusion facilitator CzcD-associated flavoprotein CzcO
MSVTRAAEVAIVGAGPYGLAAAAHLQAAGVDTVVFGEPMSFWRRHMPEGMLLRSSPSASNISDPVRRLAVGAWGEAKGFVPANPLPLEDFLAYADWFREEAGIAIDTRAVTHVERSPTGFRLRLSDDEALEVRRVVAAAGIARFARRPRVFGALPEPLVTHAVDLREPALFHGSRVTVIGAGQSALETAALLHEAGADVSIVSRATRVIWIPTPRNGGVVQRARRAAQAPTEVGPRGISWVAAVPDVFRRLPQTVQDQITPACVAPMGAYWLRARVDDIPLTLGRHVVSAEERNGRVVLRLDDGGSREADRVVLGTGFAVDVRRYEFLAPELARSLRLANGSPVLSTGFESSVPGLHFLGAPAVHSFGPVMRFVVGTAYAAPAVTQRVLGRPPRALARAW